MLQVRKPPGPKLGFGGSLEPNSLLESDKVHRSFRWGWNSILDRSVVGVDRNVLREELRES